jgi:Domain of unknown function (DUF2760)
LRIILAIQAFFAILFSGKVPPKLLPAPPAPEEPADKRAERERLGKELAEASKKLEGLAPLEEKAKQVDALTAELADNKKDLDEAEKKQATLQKDLDTAEGELVKLRPEAEKVPDLEARLEKSKDAKGEAEGKLKEARDAGALALLAWLQREGRLVDFVMESIDGYDDSQVGAAVREIHSGCARVLAEGLALEAILPGEEESPVEVPEGFDPVAIALTGNVRGEPPFKGVLMHHGWRAAEIKIPVPETVDPRVLAPAEVEL